MKKVNVSTVSPAQILAERHFHYANLAVGVGVAESDQWSLFPGPGQGLQGAAA